MFCRRSFGKSIRIDFFLSPFSAKNLLIWHGVYVPFFLFRVVLRGSTKIVGKFLTHAMHHNTLEQLNYRPYII